MAPRVTPDNQNERNMRGLGVAASLLLSTGTAPDLFELASRNMQNPFPITTKIAAAGVGLMLGGTIDFNPAN